MERVDKLLTHVGARAEVGHLKHVEFTVDQGVAVIELVDERSLNALHTGIASELGKVFDLLEARNDVACVIIRGRGRAFAAGADIKQVSFSF
jgi:enoyl-CoA hydratase/carnithine racemase